MKDITTINLCEHEGCNTQSDWEFKGEYFCDQHLKINKAGKWMAKHIWPLAKGFMTAFLISFSKR